MEPGNQSAGSSKASQMRELDRKGLSVAEIARRMGVRYQHVYNTLQPKRRKAEASSQGNVAQLSINLPPKTHEALHDQAVLEQRSEHALIVRALEEHIASLQFPGIVFTRASRGGRKARLINGLDVWEYVMVVRDHQGDVRASAEYLNEPERSVRLAMSYYERWPEDIDARLRSQEQAARDPVRQLPLATVVRV